MDLDAVLDAAPVVAFPPRGALVFPHTRLATASHLVASVARAAAHARQPVLALGVLHRARDASASLRGIHAEGGIAAEEFSLDGFRALYERACSREGITPRLTTRYPFLVGDHPDDLPGGQELTRLAQDRIVVGTGDLVHHGVGYGTAELWDETLTGTIAFARSRIEDQLGALARADFPLFNRLCSRDLSDFRDVGPVLAGLFPDALWKLENLGLVD